MIQNLKSLNFTSVHTICINIGLNGKNQTDENEGKYHNDSALGQKLGNLGPNFLSPL